LKSNEKNEWSWYGIQKIVYNQAWYILQKELGICKEKKGTIVIETEENKIETKENCVGPKLGGKNY